MFSGEKHNVLQRMKYRKKIKKEIEEAIDVYEIAKNQGSYQSHERHTALWGL